MACKVRDLSACLSVHTPALRWRELMGPLSQQPGHSVLHPASEKRCASAFASASQKVRQRNQEQTGKDQEIDVRYDIGDDKQGNADRQRDNGLLLPAIDKETESDRPE
jgi:hypothetical protein